MKTSIYRIAKLFVFIVILIGIIARNPVFFDEPRSEFEYTAHSDKLEKHVNWLSSIRPFRNFHQIDSLNKVADYIKAEFDRSCDKSYFQNFNVGKKEYKNVICFFEGKNKERIVMGAHYDVMGEQEGADDNASGVAGILEIARLVKKNNLKLENDLEIVAYTLEEPPFFKTDSMGSHIHAKSLFDSGVNVKFMLSVEMIGYFSDEFLSQNYPIPLLYLYFPFKGDFITIVGGVKEYFDIRDIKSKLSGAMDIDVYSFNAPSILPGIDFSDHLNYWLYDYTAYMITDTSFFRYDHYHQETDTPEKLDFDKMSEVVDGIMELITTVE